MINKREDYITHTTKENFTDIAYLDNGIDTFSVNGTAWINTEISDWKVPVYGYDKENTLRDNVSIRTGVTSIYRPDEETIIAWADEATLLGRSGNILMSEIEM